MQEHAAIGCLVLNSGFDLFIIFVGFFLLLFALDRPVPTLWRS